MASAITNSPVSDLRLKQIADDACNQALGEAEYYEHDKTESWNTIIINSILKSLISESSSSTDGSPPYKFAVNSTIIQHLVPTSALNKPAGTSASASTSTTTGRAEAGETSRQTSTDGKPHVGRRGMHSATGAYWNDKTDGMWSYKFEGGEVKGLDVVISVIWIGI